MPTDLTKDRENTIREFLEKHNWGKCTREKIPGDASFRRYERLKLKFEKAILMDAAPPKEDVRPFIKVAKYLIENGFSAPRIFAEDIDNGLLILEDLGNDLYSSVLKEKTKKVQNNSEYDLYAYAASCLTKLRNCEIPDFPEYSDEILMREANLFTEWYIPYIIGIELSEENKSKYELAWKKLFPLTRTIQNVVVLRDFHADNLLWLSERESIGKVGLLDFQDALIGSPAYDLVSLLEDARRDVDHNIVEQVLYHYFEINPDIDKEKFMTAYAILGAQRNLKIIGIFSRLAIRDGKFNYLKMLPRVWDNLENDLKNTSLLSIRKWINDIIPLDNRDIVPDIKTLKKLNAK